MSKEEKELIFNGNNLVTKANDVINATYKLGVTEQKVILCIASNIRPEDKDFQTYSFSIKDFKKLIKSKSQNIYSDIDKITQSLMSKPFIIYNAKGNPTRINWLSKATYNTNEGTVTVRFDPDLKPFFLALSEKFTKYKLENIIHLKSNYSIRIFELLKSYEGLTERTFTLIELKEKLGIEDKYPIWINFKDRVLERAKKELEEKTDISFTYTPIKKGRAIHKVKFKIHTNISMKAVKQENLKEQLEKIVENPDVIELHKICIQSGFKAPKSTLTKWLNSYDKKDIIAAIKMVTTRKSIKHYAPYISKVLASQVEQSSEVIELDYKDQLVQEFIYEKSPKGKLKRKEIVPDFLIKFDAIDKFSTKMPLEEAEELWNLNKKEILFAIEQNTKQALK